MMVWRSSAIPIEPTYLENIGKYHVFRQLWLVLGVKLMEINSNLFVFQVDFFDSNSLLVLKSHHGVDHHQTDQK